MAYRAEVATRNDFYYSKIYFKRIGFLYNIFNDRKKESKVCSTNEIIRPLTLQFGMKYADVIKLFRKPSFIYDNKNPNENHKAVLVRHTIHHISMLVQFQFFNDQLFFIGLDVSRSIHRPQDKTEIINTVIQKYLNKPYVSGDEFPVIEDKEGDFIIINDDVNFAICYLSGNLSEVRKYIAQQDASAEAPNKKESLFYAF